MIATQVLWTTDNNVISTPTGGWPTLKFHLLSWVLSFHQLSKYYPSTTLITDTYGSHILIDLLKLPYNSVSTILQTYDIPYPKLWVLKKIHSFANQNQPFINVDSDAYLFKPLSDSFSKADLIAQNSEFNHPYYTDTAEAVRNFPYLPKFISNIQSNHLTAINAGIIGGVNYNFFKIFEQEVLIFLVKNEKCFRNVNISYFNIFLEQYLFRQLADYNKVPITYLVKEEIGTYPYNYRLDRFTDLPFDCDYIHVMNYKRNPTVCEQMAQRLWLESPELYERVLTVCRELEATHHPVSLPDAPPASPFYRTQYVLGVVQPSATPATTPHALLTQLNALSNEAIRPVLLDAFQYEQQVREFIAALPNTATLKQDWQRWSATTNALLSLPVEVYRQQRIQRSAYFQRIESEWNWAEVNEFAGQDASRDFAQNLQAAPAYYGTILYVYIHQGVVREQLLDALNILLIDALEEPATIASVIESVSEQVLPYQPTLDKAGLAQTILGRIRHFLYQGVLIVSDE